MKKLKLFTGISLLLILTYSSIYAQEKLEKTINEEFSLEKGSTLDISCKFSNVEITNWDKNKIAVVVEISVESNKKTTAEDLLNNLGVDISQSGNIVSVKTILTTKLNTGKNTKFDINISIQAPKNINLDLVSKYGSVFIEENTGKVSANVDYGSINIGSLNRGKVKPLNEINLRYSKARIEKADWLKMDMAYSKLTMEEAKAIVLISKYSGLTVEECSSIVTDSKYDTYRIEELNNFNANMNYSNVKIEELNKKLEVESNYSTVNVEEMGPEFEFIKIDNSRGSYKIGLNPSSAFSISAEAIRCSISVPDINITSKKTENANKFFEGNYGENQKSKIDVKSKEGNVKFYFD